MTTATLAPRQRPAAPPPPRTPPRRPVARQRPDRRVFVIALALSALAHVALFIYLYFTVLPAPSTGARAPVPAGQPLAGALEVVQIVPVDGPVAEDEQTLAPVATPAPRLPGARTGFADAPADAPAERTGLSAIERLRPRMGDERVWREPHLLSIPERSGIERARERVASELGAWNDSIAAADAAAAEALDWTVEGENGERWGISPDGIHLGRITLPAPSFGGNAEGRERAGELDLIRGQATRARIYDRFDDRVAAIRARKDAERAAKKNGGN